MNEVFLVFIFSITQALLSTIFSILLALPLAHIFYKYNFFGKNLFLAIIPALSIMPTKLVAQSVLLFYGLDGIFGIILSHLVLNIPFAFYIISCAYFKLDHTFFWLAKEAGARDWRCYKDIIFPILRPAIISSFLILFLLHFTSFSIPYILGKNSFYYTPDITIYNFNLSKDNFSALIVWIFRAIVILFFLFAQNIFNKKEIKISSQPISHLSVDNIKINCNKLSRTNFYWILYLLFIGIILLGPIIKTFAYICDKSFINFFGSIFSGIKDKLINVPVYYVIVNSLIIAFLSSVLTVFVASILCVRAYNSGENKILGENNIFGENKNKFSKKNNNIFVILFIFLPFIIGPLGVGMLFSFCCDIFLNKAFCSKVISFISQYFFAILSHVFLNYVFAHRVICAQLSLYHQDITKTAQALGASDRQVFFTVIIPFLKPAIKKAFCLSFGLSLVGTGAVLMLKDKIGMTMPIAIKVYRDSGFNHAAICLSLILLFFVLFLSYIIEK